MTVELAIQEIVNKTLEERFGFQAAPLEFITIEEAAEICGCDRSVIDSLIKDFQTTNFPAVKFGERSTKVDKNRLYSWIRNGGLLNGANKESR